MKSFDVVGFTADADSWCVDCTHKLYGDDKLGAVEILDKEGNQIRPIFRDSESDTPYGCANCGVYIRASLTSDGIDYAYGMIEDALESKQRLPFLDDLAKDMSWMNLGPDDKNRHYIVRRYLGEI